MTSTVLIVEDDPDTVNLVRLYLKRDGHKVISASDGVEGLRLAREAHPDAVVLDLMLPKMDGREVCRVLREESDVPIVMLTALVEEEDRVLGLDLGADDYVTKPFSPRELAARIRAVLRRAQHDKQESVPAELVYGEVRVDYHMRRVSVDGVQIRLTPTEFRLLIMLMSEPSRVFSREQIIQRVFGYDFDGFDRVVDAHIYSLRRKLETSEGKSHYIRTVYGAGYRFNDE